MAQCKYSLFFAQTDRQTYFVICAEITSSWWSQWWGRCAWWHLKRSHSRLWNRANSLGSASHHEAAFRTLQCLWSVLSTRRCNWTLQWNMVRIILLWWVIVASQVRVVWAWVGVSPSLGCKKTEWRKSAAETDGWNYEGCKKRMRER